MVDSSYKARLDAADSAYKFAHGQSPLLPPTPTSAVRRGRNAGSSVSIPSFQAEAKKVTRKHPDRSNSDIDKFKMFDQETGKDDAGEAGESSPSIKKVDYSADIYSFGLVYLYVVLHVRDR